MCHGGISSSWRWLRVHRVLADGGLVSVLGGEVPDGVTKAKTVEITNAFQSVSKGLVVLVRRDVHGWM